MTWLIHRRKVKISNTNNGVAVGLIFTLVSYFLWFTPYPYFTLFPRIFFKIFTEKLLNGYLNRLIGIITIIQLLLILTSIVLLSISNVKYCSYRSRIISKWNVALYMILFSLFIHSLCFMVYWISWDLTISGNEALSEVKRIYPLSSLCFLLFGYIIDRIAERERDDYKKMLTR